MVFKQTAILEKALSAALRAVRKEGGHLADRAFLWLLDRKDCHAVRLLGGFVRDWELLQIKTRIQHEPALSKPAADNDRDALLQALDRLRTTIGDTSAGAPLHTGHLLLYLIRNEQFVSSRTLAMYAISGEALCDMIRLLPAEDPPLPEGEAEQAVPVPDEPDDSASPETFTTDLTRAAAAGSFDPLIGRDREIERLIRILSRRKKNNPLLIGEAGVGKSALVEGLANRIAAGQIPSALRDKRILSLDMAALIAGTKYRGEFEKRVHSLLKWIERHRDIILFIDEIHLIVGAGAVRQGGLDVANLLKPALARGNLPCIGATTSVEYRRSVARDDALARRFQCVPVRPPSAEETQTILHRLSPRYEQHHGVRYTDEALRACVGLADRYLTGRNFPDKAIDLLDEAGARLDASVTPSPPAEAGTAPASRLVTADTMRRAAEEMSGIPLPNTGADAMQTLSEQLTAAVFGQDRAIAEVIRTVGRMHTGLNDPDRPSSILLFVGPAGSGKRKLAEELAATLFGTRDALIRLDMAAYADRIRLARLTAPPSDPDGGDTLTDAVRQRPASVVLLQHIDRAHPDFFPLLREICENGTLVSDDGQRTDFRHTVIVMTLDTPQEDDGERIGYRTDTAPDDVAPNRQHAAIRRLPADLPERADGIVPFAPLSPPAMRRVVRHAFAPIAVRDGRITLHPGTDTAPPRPHKAGSTAIP